MFLPKPVANESDGRAARPIFLRGETAAENRFNPKRRQVISHDGRTSRAFRFAATGQIERALHCRADAHELVIALFVGCKLEKRGSERIKAFA